MWKPGPMHSRGVALAQIVAGVLLAVGSVLAFPHADERRYTDREQEVTGADGATPYEDLSPQARQAFGEARNDTDTAYGDPPLSPNASIVHRDDTCRVSATARE